MFLHRLRYPRQLKMFDRQCSSHVHCISSVHIVVLPYYALYLQCHTEPDHHPTSSQQAVINQSIKSVDPRFQSHPSFPPQQTTHHPAPPHTPAHAPTFCKALRTMGSDTAIEGYYH